MIKTKNKEYTKLDTFRYERKFKPESLSIRQIENIVLGSAAFFRLIYHPRYVNNIYFDDICFSHYIKIFAYAAADPVCPHFDLFF